MADKIDGVYSILTANTQFDATLIPRVSTANTQANTVGDALIANGYSSLGSALKGAGASFVAPQAQLANHVTVVLDDLSSRMDAFIAVKNLDGADGNTVAQAFGALFTARNLLSSFDAISNTLAMSPAPEWAANELAARVQYLVSAPAAIPNAITAENTFYSASLNKLNLYAQAVDLVSLVDQEISLRSVIGAVGSLPLVSLLAVPVPVDSDGDGIPDTEDGDNSGGDGGLPGDNGNGGNNGGGNSGGGSEGDGDPGNSGVADPVPVI